MRRSKKAFLLIFLILLVYSAVEFTIFVTGHIGTVNIIRRTIADAPKVEWNSKTLAYVGTENFASSILEPFGNETHADLVVYKLAAAPNNPPYLYVHKNNGSYFKYRIPKVAWSM